MLDAGGGGGSAEVVDRLTTMPMIPGISIAGIGAAAGKYMKKVGGSHGEGGGYTFTPEEIDQVIQQWEDLRDGLMEDEKQALDVSNVQAPGREFASGDFERAAGPSGETLLIQTQRMLAYVEKYIEALKEAKGATQAQDEQAAEEIGSTGGMLNA